MSAHAVVSLALVTFGFALGAAPGPLTSREDAEIQERLQAFYAWPPDPSQMDRPLPKSDPENGRPLELNAKLRLQEAVQPQDPLLRLAQVKATREFQAEYCRTFLSKHFPKIQCDGEGVTSETAQENDRVEELAETWLRPEDILSSLDGLPIAGKVRSPYWSGDYWPTRLGGISYRYRDGVDYRHYRAAIEAYAQPGEWLRLLAPFVPEPAERAVHAWSPAEKYDLMVGDTRFTLTNHQKKEGERSAGAGGNVALWMGICHGWAPAAVLTPTPVRPARSIGANGVPVTWDPDDVKALVTLAWANGKFESNFAGGRCEAVNPRRYPNGRLIDRDCFDTNPSVLHRALGNLIGRYGLPFLMDSAYDYEVWNQPIVEYQLEYFNPNDPSRRSQRWTDVAVPYDQTFKRRDRFQQPLTRGNPLPNGRWDDREIRQIVGVVATVIYLYEVSAGSRARDRTVRVVYTYDLELSERGGQLVALGGEWHQNAHPDFLWLPRRGSIPDRPHDRARVTVDLARAPSAALTAAAVPASAEGYPLCAVVAAVASEAANGAKYSCMVAPPRP